MKVSTSQTITICSITHVSEHESVQKGRAITEKAINDIRATEFQILAQAKWCMINKAAIQEQKMTLLQPGAHVVV